MNCLNICCMVSHFATSPSLSPMITSTQKSARLQLLYSPITLVPLHETPTDQENKSTTSPHGQNRVVPESIQWSRSSTAPTSSARERRRRHTARRSTHCTKTTETATAHKGDQDDGDGAGAQGRPQPRRPATRSRKINSNQIKSE